MKKQEEYYNLISNFYLEQEQDKKPEVVDTELVKQIIRQRTLSGGSLPGIPELDSISLNSVNSGPSFHPSPHTSHFQRIGSVRSVTSTVAIEAGMSNEALDTEFVSEPEEAEKDKTVLIKGEQQQTGSVSPETYLVYIKATGGFLVSLFTGLLFILVIFGITLDNWWLSLWINAGGALINCTNPTYAPPDYTGSGMGETNFTIATTPACNPTRDPNISTGERLGFYQGIYFAILALTIVVSVMKATMYVRSTTKSATQLHKQLFETVFGSPMTFFDTTPTGRILNRFSKDMDDIDVRLPFIMDMFLQQILFVLFAVVTMVIVFPWFLIAIAVIVVLFGFVYKYFRTAVREFKRVDNVTRSPWISHVTSTVQGLSTIHAYNKTDDFIQTFCKQLDRNAAPYYAYLCSMRWLSCRLDCMSISVTILVALFVIFSTIFPETFGETSASFAGLALSYAVTLTGMFQVCVRFSVETESYFTSVERVNEYITTCPSEQPVDKQTKEIPKNWPHKGEIRFKNICMRYRPDLPLVLKNVSLTIKQKEKIGIVGRTGSGTAI
uniref:multidrug resistance-associated protein 5-like n=1 Tax=Ciona intestinalis TaxID=7719 RepID=UPI000EF461A1|nr:multidrug resistance-associated protein 5-like [Ciona intestinalis]|eukprot:XP_026695465.1 multidrug resistance-associated protein 5-like [Ciona intestinalis]